MKICIAMVTNRQVKPATVLSLANMVKRTPHEVFILMATEGYTTAEGRNYSAIQAEKEKCDYLLFVDDDMVFPPDTLDRLLEHRKRVIGVASNSRMLPLESTVALMDEHGEYLPREKLPPWKKLPDEVFKCYSVGAGVMLIAMEVFRFIEKPWFHFETFENGRIKNGEDAWFCGRARAKGIEIWCDPTIPIGHIGNYTY